MHEMSCFTELFSDRMPFGVEHVADQHLRALGHQRLRVGGSHTAGATGDQRHLALNSSRTFHRRLPYTGSGTKLID